MKLAALALDYDGTSAVDGVFDKDVRSAIEEARRRGVAVVLVTGRRIAELRQVAGDLRCFDVVVGENGAVLEFPESGRHVVLSHPPRQEFLDELRRRGVPFAAGETVVETGAGWAAPTLEAIRQLEQPLVLAFNRGRLMILPQAVSKSTGLRHALASLRVSIHNTVGIGDAENDHDLLDACEVGVAVGWGSRALRAVADTVVDGEGPPALAGYIRGLLGQTMLSAAQMGRRRVVLGSRRSGQPVSLAVRGRTIFIAGEPGTGKSWLAGLLCEQLVLQGYCLCIIDPEGDYRSLDALPGVITLGGEDPPPTPRDLLRALRHPDVSIILDLSRLAHQEKVQYLRTLLPLLRSFRHRTGLPHKVLLDEAHHYLGDTDSERLLDTELPGYILVTYRISGLCPSIRCSRDAVVLVTRETDPDETAALLALCRPCDAPGVEARVFADLSLKEAALLPGPEESLGRVRKFTLGPRLTSHVRHREKYLDMPVADDRAFVFTDAGRASARAVTLKDFLGLLGTLPESQIEGHARRHDFSRWFDEVFRDHPVAARVRAIEDRAGDESPKDISTDIAQAVRARYEMTGVAEAVGA
jgi:hydroxymethylpyrimidine pyrophosphatase-like HAD family hydrolase